MIDTSRQPASQPPQPPPRREEARRLLATEAASLGEALGQTRRRLAGHEALRGALLALAGAAAALLLAVALVALKQTWGRPFGLALAAGALVALLGRTLVRARRALRDDVAAARALGRGHPAEASDLVSAVELARDWEQEPLSRPLARAHLVRMGTRARLLDPALAAPWRPVLAALGVAAAAVAAHLLLLRAGGERVRSAWTFLAYRAAPDHALFAPEPIAGDITLVYRYPAHMNRPARTVAGTAGDISAPKGTVVELSARADRDTPRALAVVAGKAVPLQVNGRQLAGTLVVSEAGDWKLRFENASGRLLAEGPPRPVTVEPDAVPTVKVIAPAAEQEVDPGDSVTLTWEAADDYGLANVELVFTPVRGGQEERRPLATPAERPRRQRGENRWDLAPLKLEPGDRVTYRLEATDNDTVSGPKKSISAVHVLKVFSPVEHHHEVLKKAEEQWEKLVSGLGDRLEEPTIGEAGEGATKEWETRHAAKDQALANLARDMRKLGHELSEDKRAPPEIGRALANVGSRLANAVGRTATFRKALVSGPYGAGIRAFRGVLAAEIAEEERDVLYLEDLIDRRKLLDLKEMTRELEQGRRELARLVEKYRRAPDEQTKRALMGEVARLKERLHNLFQRMQELARGIQDEHLNEEATERLDEGRDMLSQLDEIQRQLAKGESDEALKALEELQKSIAKMEQQFGEDAGEMDESMKQAGKQLQKLASDLVDLEAEQKALKNETDALRQKSRKELERKLQQLGREFVERQRERVRRAREETKGIDRALAEQLYQEEDLQTVEERLDQLDQALQAGDFDEALDSARSALMHGQEIRLRLNVEREAARRMPGFVKDPKALDESARRAERAEKPMREVTEDLDKLLRDVRQAPGPEDQKQLEQLAKRQGAARRQTEQLQRDLEELGKQVPLFGPGQARLLQEAGSQMGEARGKLEQSDPRGASSRQQQALEQLGRLREAMKGSQQGGGQGIPMPFASADSGGEGDGDGFRSEKVEIPGADQSRAPEEFRRDLLDAMKDRTPERYRERVRDYYEELVR